MLNKTRTNNGPERDHFIEDVASVLSRGYTLLATDVEQFMPAYGYSGTMQSFHVLEAPQNHTASDFALEGVKLVVERYKGRKLYRDGNLVQKKTDIANTRERIDNRLTEMSNIKKATTVRNRELRWYSRNPAGYEQYALELAEAAGIKIVGWQE